MNKYYLVFNFKGVSIGTMLNSNQFANIFCDFYDTSDEIILNDSQWIYEPFYYKGEYYVFEPVLHNPHFFNIYEAEKDNDDGKYYGINLVEENIPWSLVLIKNSEGNIIYNIFE